MSNPLSRRESLAALGALALAGNSAGAAKNAIVTENERPGTKDWLLEKVALRPGSKVRVLGIEGYCSHRSAATGETIKFFVSTDPVSKVNIDIYRLGYYGGLGGRLMKRLGEFAGLKQADPVPGAKRKQACQWKATAELKIPKDWLSGVYLVKLTALESGQQSYIVFVICDTRQADYLFQCSDNTWQAYNRWPLSHSLYDDGKEAWHWGGNVLVGFQRPYGKYLNFGDFPLSSGSGEFLMWEYPFAFWLEKNGYDVTYISNDETHRDAAGLQRAQGFLSIGHDEYWSIEMFNNVKKALEAGVSLGFFSGNAVCGRIEFDKEGHFERVGVFGPPGGTREFANMKTLKHERPYANELIGAHSTGPVTGGADWICLEPEHWLYEKTGMKKGDAIPGLIGWEYHGDPAKIPGLKVVAGGPTQSAPGKPNDGHYTATVYTAPSGAVVFNASTIWWADGLSDPPGYVRPKVYTEPKGVDPRVQQMTANVLAKMKRK